MALGCQATEALEEKTVDAALFFCRTIVFGKMKVAKVDMMVSF